MNRDRGSSEGQSPRGAPQTSNENSGLIDLRALMAAAKSTSRETSAAAPPRSREEPADGADSGHLAVYPLGAPPSQRPPAPSAPALVLDPRSDARQAPARAGRAQKAFAVGAVLVLVGVATGATVLLTGRSPSSTNAGVGQSSSQAAGAGQTSSTPAGNARVNVAPPGDATPDTAAQRDKAPADTAAPGTTSSPNTRARPGKPGPLPTPAKPPAGQPPATSQKTPPVTSPKADPCKGDLLCAMKRSTEHH
jgi:hypothetical protein